MQSSTKLQHGKPTLTMFTDASIQTRPNRAGWGGWARGDDRNPTWSKGEASWHRSSCVVEMEAIAKMLLHTAHSGYMQAMDRHILIQSDSLIALNTLRGALGNSYASNRETGAAINPKGVIPKNRDMDDWIEIIRTLTNHCQVVYLRHVYAHREGVTVRSHVNEMCDRLAKEGANP